VAPVAAACGQWRRQTPAGAPAPRQRAVAPRRSARRVASSPHFSKVNKYGTSPVFSFSDAQSAADLAVIALFAQCTVFLSRDKYLNKKIPILCIFAYLFGYVYICLNTFGQSMTNHHFRSEETNQY